ncbi:hypothetical protein B6U71_03725 [Euryarchaeota archaeon ex4484_178]|nr:MAG: hypothetical protein B6U71_03725 [Euryarchaeota archaeon ex4484_178]
MNGETEQNYVAPLPPEAESIKDLVKYGGLSALIIGILLVWTVVGIIVGILIWMKSKDIIKLVDERKYKEAKEKTLIWMILGFLFTGIIPGILLLMAYLKFDEVISKQQIAPPPPPPSTTEEEILPP